MPLKKFIFVSQISGDFPFVPFLLFSCELYYIVLLYMMLDLVDVVSLSLFERISTYEHKKCEGMRAGTSTKRNFRVLFSLVAPKGVYLNSAGMLHQPCGTGTHVSYCSVPYCSDLC